MAALTFHDVSLSSNPNATYPSYAYNGTAALDVYFPKKRPNEYSLFFNHPRGDISYDGTEEKYIAVPTINIYSGVQDPNDLSTHTKSTFIPIYSSPILHPSPFNGKVDVYLEPYPSKLPNKYALYLNNTKNQINNYSSTSIEYYGDDSKTLTFISLKIMSEDGITVYGRYYPACTDFNKDEITIVIPTTPPSIDVGTTATALPNPYALTLGSYTYDGSTAVTGTFPASVKNPYSLTLGSYTYDGSADISATFPAIPTKLPNPQKVEFEDIIERNGTFSSTGYIGDQETWIHFKTLRLYGSDGTTLVGTYAPAYKHYRESGEERYINLTLPASSGGSSEGGGTTTNALNIKKIYSSSSTSSNTFDGSAALYSVVKPIIFTGAVSATVWPVNYSTMDNMLDSNTIVINIPTALPTVIENALTFRVPYPRDSQYNNYYDWSYNGSSAES
jgi:hypothetical protein